MKTIRKTILALTAFYLSFFGYSYGQEPTVTITLKVDTTLLGNDRNAPGGCEFIVEPSSVVIVNDPNDPKTFAINVSEDDIIEWQGITTTGQDVKIKKIKFIGGTEIFGSGTVNGQSRNGKEKVKAKPIRTTPSGKDYEYSIRFKTKGMPYYVIDPKIKVRNQ